MWMFLFTTDSLFVHISEPLVTTKQRYMKYRRNANKMRVLIRRNACFLQINSVSLQEINKMLYL